MFYSAEKKTANKIVHDLQKPGRRVCR